MTSIDELILPPDPAFEEPQHFCHRCQQLRRLDYGILVDFDIYRYYCPTCGQYEEISE